MKPLELSTFRELLLPMAASQQSKEEVGRCPQDSSVISSIKIYDVPTFHCDVGMK